MQRFNFDVLHIDGEKSVEADALSRLVSLPARETSDVNDVGTRSSRFARNYITLSSGAQKIVIERLERLDLKWSGMRKDASTFIHSCCPCCQKKSKLNRSHKQCHLRYACYTRK